MYVHVGNVFDGYVIAKPLMTTFMDDDKVKSESQGPTSSAVTELVTISIGYSRLMFHSGVIGFNQFISIFIKGIGTEPILEAIEHFVDLIRHIIFCFLQIIVHDPIIQIQVTSQP